MCPAQHKFAIVERLLGQKRKGFLADLENLPALKQGRAHPFGGEKTILGVVFADLKHRRILKFYFVCHSFLCNVYV